MDNMQNYFFGSNKIKDLKSKWYENFKDKDGPMQDSSSKKGNLHHFKVIQEKLDEECDEWDVNLEDAVKKFKLLKK